MASEIFAIDTPERRIEHALVYRGTITGNSSHPTDGYSTASIAARIDFMVFHGVSAYIWDFDKTNQVINVYKINTSSGLREEATGADLDGESMSYEAFVYVG